MSKASKQRARRRRRTAAERRTDQPAVVEIQTDDDPAEVFTRDLDVAHSLAPVLAAAGPEATLAAIQRHVYDEPAAIADELPAPLPDPAAAAVILELRQAAADERQAERIEFLEATE